MRLQKAGRKEGEEVVAELLELWCGGPMTKAGVKVFGAAGVRHCRHQEKAIEGSPPREKGFARDEWVGVRGD